MFKKVISVLLMYFYLHLDSLLGIKFPFILMYLNTVKLKCISAVYTQGVVNVQ